MKILGIDVDLIAPQVAASMAHEDDKVQAKFLGVFADELKKACATSYAVDQQLFAIRSYLTDEQRALFAALAGE